MLSELKVVFIFNSGTLTAHPIYNTTNTNNSKYTVIFSAPLADDSFSKFPDGLSFSFPRVVLAFYLSPHQLLKRDAGVYHKHLTHIRPSPVSLSLVADTTEPRPPATVDFYQN